MAQLSAALLLEALSWMASLFEALLLEGRASVALAAERPVQIGPTLE